VGDKRLIQLFRGKNKEGAGDEVRCSGGGGGGGLHAVSDASAQQGALAPDFRRKWFIDCGARGEASRRIASV
jgi:hypothetical protein